MIIARETFYFAEAIPSVVVSRPLLTTNKLLLTVVLHAGNDQEDLPWRIHAQSHYL